MQSRKIVPPRQDPSQLILQFADLQVHGSVKESKVSGHMYTLSTLLSRGRLGSEGLLVLAPLQDRLLGMPATSQLGRGMSKATLFTMLKQEGLFSANCLAAALALRTISAIAQTNVSRTISAIAQLLSRLAASYHDVDGTVQLG